MAAYTGERLSKILNLKLKFVETREGVLFVDLSGKVAIVTGSGQGIGESIAKVFAQNGALVVVATRSPENGEATVKDIKNSGYRKIVLHAAWVHQHYPMTPEEFRQKISLTLHELEKIEGIQIVIVGNSPRWKHNPYQIEKFEKDYITSNDIKYYKDDTILDIDEIMIGLQSEYDFEYLSIIKSVCIYNNNERYCPLKSSDNFLYKDWGHLNKYGSNFVITSLDDFF